MLKLPKKYIYGTVGCCVAAGALLLPGGILMLAAGAGLGYYGHTKINQWIGQ